MPGIVTALKPRASQRRIMIAILAAMLSFLAYSSVYAYRKPFTIATFEGLKFWGVSYQSLLIIGQVIGYMLSKFAGIRFISELKVIGRFKTGVVLIGIAWLCLLALAIVPAPFGVLFMLINGFMLGFMWGIIFSYVEGRMATDFIGAVMAISFIFAGGFTRSVAKWLMVEWNVTERWMPFVTGLIFAAPLLLLLWSLEKVPPPDDADIKERTVRLPMDRKSRKHFFGLFAPGLVIVCFTYVILTIMRDVRDNYMGNIWDELGYANNFSIFTNTETTISLLVLAIMASLAFVRQNLLALTLVHFVIAAGLAMAAIASLLFVNGRLDGASWMQWTGLGLYMGYIPFNCIFFERLIASFRAKGNAGFLIYFADAFGYLGSVVVMLSKEFLPGDMKWSVFYSNGVVIVATFGLIGITISWLYFKNKSRRFKASVL